MQGTTHDVSHGSALRAGTVSGESAFALMTVDARTHSLRSTRRAYHWKAVRAATGLTQSLYLCTRHFAGWYMVNVLELDSEDVAFALGHTDDGDLVRKLYGHRDRDLALDRVTAAHKRAGAIRPLRVVRDDVG